MSGKKVVVVHQPDFIPYLGFFHRLMQADAWVVLDHVQLNDAGWVHRDKIKTAYGCKWISLPLQKNTHLASINSRLLSITGDWRQQHLAKWQDAYKKSPFFDEVWPHLESIYACKASFLCEFTLHSIEVLLELLDIRLPEQYESHTLGIEDKSNELVAKLVSKVGGTHYLSGVGARDYHDDAPYEAAGIEVIWQNFTHPIYPQLHGEFVPYLTTVDTLFNCGVNGTKEMLRKTLK